jgi:DNA invertase Pin-like site-specific DNA recombinase
MSKRTAYSYLRFSTPEQMNGDSQRRQIEGAERACVQFGWELSETSFRDLGVSSYRGDNRKKGDLSLFLRALQAGELEKDAVLILEDFDRLSRDKIMPSFDLVRRILEGGIDVFCVMTGRLYTVESLNEPMSILEMIWRFYLAHQESEKKAVRSRENWRAKRAKAHEEIMTSICPGWLRVVDGRFEPIPKRVKIVHDIFAWCIGGLGISRIAQRLNREKVPAAKGAWSQKTVFQILTDGRVLGRLPSNLYGEKVTPGQVISGYYPAVVDEATVNLAIASMQARKTASGRPAKGGFVNLFAGLVRYPEHDASMVLMTKPCRGHSYRYLVSMAGHRGHADGAAVPYDHAEATLLKYLKEIKPEDFLPKEKDDEEARMEAELAFVTRRIGELSDSLEQVGASVPAVVQKIADFERRKSQLTADLSKVKRRVTPAAVDTAHLINLLGTTKGEELTGLREQIHQRLLLLLDRIDASITAQDSRRKTYTFRVVFKNGLTRTMYFKTGATRELVEDGLILDGDPASTYHALDSLASAPCISPVERRRREVDAEILALRRSGRTYDAIRAATGAGKNRVWSVCRAAGLTTELPPEKRKPKKRP